MKPTLLTVILNYKTAEMTLRSAESALAAMKNIAGEVIIVDNDSGDGSYEKMSAHVEAANWSRVRVVQSGHNGGYGAGNNVGLRAALSNGTKPDYYYILNSDAFPHENAVELLVEHLQANPTVGAAGSYIHGDDDAPHVNCFRFPSAMGELEMYARIGPISRLLKNSIMPLPPSTETKRVDWTPGASLLVRRKVLETAGYFDEGYFLYFDETDFCRRIYDAGWTIDVVGQSRVMHIGSVSTGMKTWDRIPKFWLDSRWRYFNKHHGAIYAWAATAMLVAGCSINLLRSLISTKPRQEPNKFMRDVMKHHLGAAFRRKTDFSNCESSKTATSERAA